MSAEKLLKVHLLKVHNKTSTQESLGDTSAEVLGWTGQTLDVRLP